MRLYSSVRSSASGLSSVPSSCPSLATSLSLSNTVGSFHETHHRSTGFIPACLPFLSTVRAPFLFLSPRLCSLSSARLPLPLNFSSILIPLSPLSSVSSTPFFSVVPTVSPARATFCRMACLTAGHGRSLSRLLKSPPREPPWLLRFGLGRFQWRSRATFSIIGRESYRLALLLPTLFDRPLPATCLCRKRLCRAMAGRWIGKYRPFTIFIAIRIIINIDRLGSV